MKDELESEKIPQSEGLIAEDLILTIDDLLQIDYDNSKVLFIKVKILYILGKREEALKILQNLETNCKDNKEFLFFVYDKMAHIYHNFDAKEEELKTCQKLISLAEEMEDNEKLGAAYCDMGNCLRDKEMDKAFDYFQSSVELLERSDLLGSAYGSMYWIQQQKGNFSKAEEYLKKSLEIFIKSNNKRKECTSKANLGVLYYKSNQLSEALKLMQEAYHTASQLHDLDGEAAITGNIGKIYMKRGIFPKAIEHFRQAYHIASQIKNPRAQECWLVKMSKVYKEMGNLKKSEFFLKESKKFEELSDVKKEDKKQTVAISY
ncbi:MAG: tetratricopeptide repeat protein [Candidatus Cloacimonetes bacterium]|nr:tetratricopeptide repeat protein [Candidatus Cloacimonadota bacterium]